jgi:hypothetical protein
MKKHASASQVLRESSLFLRRPTYDTAFNNFNSVFCMFKLIRAQRLLYFLFALIFKGLCIFSHSLYLCAVFKNIQQ